MPNKRGAAQDSLQRKKASKQANEKTNSRPSKRAPDGWDSARFLEMVLSYGKFPFRELALPSRR
jgi:hypothetical protein